MKVAGQPRLPLETPRPRHSPVVAAAPAELPPAAPPRERAAPAELWCAIVLPALLLEVRPAAPGTPLAVVEPARREILAVNRAAAAAGVRAGQSSTTAWAVCPALAAVARDPEAEARALERLAGWAAQFSPRLAIEPPGLVLEVGASLRLFGGLASLRERLEAGLAGLGYTFRLGIAPTPLAALWRARCGHGEPVTGHDRLPGSLACLPLAAMALDPRTHAALEDLGLATVGEVMRLPRAGLARRYGTELTRLLDRALGRHPDPRPAWQAPPVFEGRLELPVESSSLKLIGIACERLAGELAGFVRAREAAVRSLEVRLETPAEAVATVLECHAPLRDAGRILALVMTRLEATALPGPVRKVAMRSADFVEHAPERGFAIIENAESSALDAVLSRIAARLGGQALVRLAPGADHRPEHASRIWRPGRRGPGEAGIVRPGWPLLLLARPRPLPCIADAPSAGGRLEALAPPERIESGWWDGRGVARDYYRMGSPGGAEHWVYRDRVHGGWFLHGHFL